MELEKKLRGKITILLVLAFALYIVFNQWNNVMGMLSSVYELFFPFILGGCIAFIINIPVTFISKKLLKLKRRGPGKVIRKYNRAISIVLSCFLILGVLASISSIIIPNIIDTVKILPTAFDSSTIAFQNWLDSNTWLSNNVTNLVNNMGIDWENIFNTVKSTAFNSASTAVLSTLQAATTFASATVEFILAFIFAIYILAQKERLGIQFKKLLYAFMKKENVDSILEVLNLTSETFSNFITGQCTVSAILAMLFFITLMLFQLPYALVISIVIGFFSIIPVLGSAIGCALGTFLLLMVSPIKAGIFLFIFVAIKQLEDNLIYPKVVGSSIGLPSIWVLFAITLGGKTFGVPGMIIFIPLCSVAYVLLRKEVNIRLEKKALKIE
ncbi:AI-2E family transporter [Clostridium zeae]|uniref:AI-2E family transporter n=1 Tax=Clostridium zeae TaxID=2759022 RepID=A0ABQ1EBC4_9CLOT|nr:AI-2E family transporter [Clostridium zeae]GFZ32097.1 AI-2E family transporter [Clostridium zeae]